MLGAYLLSVRSTEPAAISKEDAHPFGNWLAWALRVSCMKNRVTRAAGVGHGGGSLAVQCWEGDLAVQSQMLTSEQESFAGQSFGSRGRKIYQLYLSTWAVISITAQCNRMLWY